MPPNSRFREYFLQHEYYRTYEVAGIVEKVVADPFPYVRELEALFVNDGVLAFVHPYRRSSALHLFTEFIVEHLLEEDVDGPRLVVDPAASIDVPTAGSLLPVEAACRLYGIDHLTFEQFRRWPSFPHDSCLSDQYYSYWLELRISLGYDQLLNQICDEVFHVMFLNRTALADLNRLIGSYVASTYPSTLDDEHVKLFVSRSADGRLRRKRPPRWARRAVFYRDRGLCSYCGVDLSGLINTLGQEHYDHMISLHDGGLNDVTNLQLLCRDCNLKKGPGGRDPSTTYQRWYSSK